jgi:hypothetical protein
VNVKLDAGMPVIDVATVACSNTYTNGEFVVAACVFVLCTATFVATARAADCSDATPLGGVVDSSALTEPEPASVIDVAMPLTPSGESTAPALEIGVPVDAATDEAGNGLVPFDPPPVLHAATANARTATNSASRIRDNVKLHRFRNCNV